MTGPSWLAAAFAAVMIVTAVYCAGRLAASRLWRRPTEVDADSAHVVMGVAMAGMLLPGLRALPTKAWDAVFMAAAIWFAYQGARNRLRQNALSQWRCSDPVPHLVESAAMVYMLATLPGSWPDGTGRAMAMPGMGTVHPAAGGSLPALAVILALFMTGYVFWTADRLTSMMRATVATASGAVRDKSRTLVTPHRASDMHGPAGASETDIAARSPRPGGAALAPGLAACYKIAMGITMGYTCLSSCASQPAARALGQAGHEVTLLLGIFPVAVLGLAHGSGRSRCVGAREETPRDPALFPLSAHPPPSWIALTIRSRTEMTR